MKNRKPHRKNPINEQLLKRLLITKKRAGKYFLYEIFLDNYDTNIGIVLYDPFENAQEIEIKKGYEQQGIGTYVYDMIERDFGVILKPGPVLSEVGEKFWEKRKNRQLRQKNPQGPIILNKDYDDAGQIVLGNTPYNSSIAYFGIRVLVKPSIFSKLVPHDNKNVDYIIEWLLAGKPIGAPFLKILIPYKNWNNGEFEPAKILGHEGRTRMRAIRRTFGDIPVETHLIIKTENRFIEGREALINGPLNYNIYLNLLNRAIWDEHGFFLIKGPWFTIK